jgi:hypothetical protein
VPGSSLRPMGRRSSYFEAHFGQKYSYRGMWVW